MGYERQRKKGWYPSRTGKHVEIELKVEIVLKAVVYYNSRNADPIQLWWIWQI